MTSKLHKICLILVIVIALGLKLEGLFFDFFKSHHVCYIDRFVPGSPRLDAYLSMLMLMGTYILIALMIALATLKQRINFLKGCYMTAMNLGGYCFVIFLKEYLADSTCNQSKSNSVSGHFAFYFFHLLTLPYVWRQSHWPDDGEPYGQKPKQTSMGSLMLQLVRIVYVAFVILTATTLYRTYVFGYHTPAQCVNGVILAALMHLACVHLMRHLDHPTEKAVEESRKPRPSIGEVEADVPLILFGIFSGVSIYLAYIYHGSIPLDTWELLVNVGAWARILWGT